MPDHTHDPTRRSWVESANDPSTDFPIQNLPFGVFRVGDAEPRIGVAIGDSVLDVRGAVETGRLDGIGNEAAGALVSSTLNAFLACGRPVWTRVRAALGGLLDEANHSAAEAAELRRTLLKPESDVRMLVPAEVGDYTDFYCSIHHATNVGSMFRPDNPLLPNYKHLPVGYHGRASSLVASGTPIRRPLGQTVAGDGETPAFGPCRLLDYELELGFLTGPGNTLGTRITMHEAADRIFGLLIVNDWSARDVQKWEYQPLGPFNAKNFATTLSPWVVSLDALEPFRVAGPDRPANDPPVLDYLAPADPFGLDIVVEASIASQAMREQDMPAQRISVGNFRDMYWTIAQMLVHHTSTGCNMRPGDLIASGTVSGPDEGSRGCLLERTWRGQQPVELPDGTERKFLADGDEVIMRAWCERDGTARIGFGECRGIVTAAE